jgi:hypothetical protein
VGGVGLVAGGTAVRPFPVGSLTPHAPVKRRARNVRVEAGPILERGAPVGFFEGGPKKLNLRFRGEWGLRRRGRWRGIGTGRFRRGDFDVRD